MISTHFNVRLTAKLGRANLDIGRCSLLSIKSRQVSGRKDRADTGISGRSLTPVAGIRVLCRCIYLDQQFAEQPFFASRYDNFAQKSSILPPSPRWFEGARSRTCPSFLWYVSVELPWGSMSVAKMSYASQTTQQQLQNMIAYVQIQKSCEKCREWMGAGGAMRDLSARGGVTVWCLTI